MAFTVADLAIIEDAIRVLATGKRVTELRFSERTIQYESATMADLLGLRDQIKADVAANGPRRSRIIRLYRSGGGMHR